MEQKAEIIFRDAKNVVIVQNNHGEIVFEKEIPELLTPYPTFVPDNFVGRTQETERLEGLVAEQQQIIGITGIGGIGKSTLAKYYFHEQVDQYTHTAWVDAVTDLRSAFTENVQLVDSLNLTTTFRKMEQDRVENLREKKFDLLINRLNQLQGSNLLIIDNVGKTISDEEDPSVTRADENQLLEVVSGLLHHFTIVITSRQEYQAVYNFRIDLLEPEEAQELFLLYYDFQLRKQSKQLEQNIAEIARMLDYHPLLLEITAKVGHEEKYLLSELIEDLRSAGLSSLNLDEDDIEDPYNRLMQLFTMSKLSDQERWLLAQFAVLPSIEIEFEELADFLNVDLDNRRQKRNLNKPLTKLEKSGWITEYIIPEEDGTDYYYYKAHSLIREAIQQEEPPTDEDCQALLNYFGPQMQSLINQNDFEQLPYKPFLESLTQYFPIQPGDLEKVYANLAQLQDLVGNYADALSIRQTHYELCQEEEEDDDGYLLTRLGLGNALAVSFYYNGEDLAANDLLLELIQETEIEKAHIFAERINLADSNYLVLGQLLISMYTNYSLVCRNLLRPHLAVAYSSAGARLAQLFYRGQADHVEVANACVAKGMAFASNRNYDKAVRLFKQTLAIDIHNNENSEIHPKVAGDYRRIADLYALADNFEEARLFIDRAVEVYQTCFPEGHPLLDDAWAAQQILKQENPEAYAKFLKDELYDSGMAVSSVDVENLPYYQFERVVNLDDLTATEAQLLGSLHFLSNAALQVKDIAYYFGIAEEDRQDLILTLKKLAGQGYVAAAGNRYHLSVVIDVLIQVKLSNWEALQNSLAQPFTASETSDAIYDPAYLSSLIDKVDRTLEMWTVQLQSQQVNQLEGMDWISDIIAKIPLTIDSADLLRLGHACQRLGYCYKEFGQMEMALKFEEKGVEAFENVEPVDVPGLFRAYNNIAITYKNLGDLTESIIYGLKAKRIGEENPELISKDLLRTIHNTLSNVYRRDGYPDESLVYAEKALQMVRNNTENFSSRDQYMAIVTMANALRELKRFEEAAAHFEEARTYVQGQGINANEKMIVMINSMELHQAMGQSSKIRELKNFAQENIDFKSITNTQLLQAFEQI